jgi:hypothetical protein
MLVLSVGFDDTAQEAARQELVFGGVEEAEELLMTMLLHGRPKIMPSSTFEPTGAAGGYRGKPYNRLYATMMQTA